MKIIEGSLKNSTAVLVAIILTTLFGGLALTRIPIQLNPTIATPYITVETLYPGAAAIEVEQEITRRLEEQLASVEDLREMRSYSAEGLSRITLQFDWGVNKDISQLNVLQKINLAEELPEDAEEPQILTVSRFEQITVLWTWLKADPDKVTVDELRELADDVIIPNYLRITDVADVRYAGGAEREIHVLADLAAIAARDLTLNEVAEGLRRENRNVRGGKIEQGAGRLVVRTLGQYTNLEQIRETVIKETEHGPVRIRDIAEVVDSHEEREALVRVNGTPTISMGVIQRSGANTLQVAEEVKKVIAQLNEGLASRGIELLPTYDASIYIWNAIYQLRDNLILGSILATAILWIFLRSLAATLVVGITIPICMVGTFILLIVFGRSVNVVSLAGLAFASGMIVDNGIVVVENIFRHRTDLGKSILKASLDGAKEVWGPIVASTLTTLAVFIPILFIEERAGQLFRDLAYSISFAVALSMICAITVVPMLSSRWLGHLSEKGPDGGPHEPTFGPARAVHRLVDPIFGGLGSMVAGIFYGIVAVGLRNMWALGVVVLVIVGIFIGSFSLIPPAEYLPQGNENFILGSIRMPAGMSLEGANELVEKIEQKVLTLPELERTFFLTRRDNPFFGVILKPEMADKATVQRIAGELNAFARAHFPFPDVIAFIFQSPVFTRGSQGKSLSIDISGPDLQKLQEYANRVADQVRGLEGVLQVRPSLDLYNPELQVIPDRERLADLGMTASDVADIVETLLEGKTTSLYREGGKEYDLVLKAQEQQIVQLTDLGSVLISAPNGEKVKLADLARVKQRHGPVAVEHLEQDRSVTLEVTVQEDFALESFIDEVNDQVIGPLLPNLPLEYQVGLSGSADDLEDTVVALSGSFTLALIIVYLLMAALFRSFFYPFIIMFSVPLAMTGAFLGIALTGAEFNVITMLGFILLAGVVVNNAILLVQVTLEGLRRGLSQIEAIEQGIRLRIRPIFMTSVTSVLGMLPMASGKGTGSDLYNGLGVAVIGGLTLSTLFTLILIPLLIKLFVGLKDGLVVRLGREDMTELGTARRLAELDAEV